MLFPRTVQAGRDAAPRTRKTRRGARKPELNLFEDAF